MSLQDKQAAALRGASVAAHAAERRADYLRALEEELAGYEQQGRTERAADVKAEIKRVKAEDSGPVGRQAPSADDAGQTPPAADAGKTPPAADAADKTPPAKKTAPAKKSAPAKKTAPAKS